MSTAIVTLNYESTSLLFDRETNTGDLTALWRAAGSPETKRPIDWTRGAQAQEILEALAEQEKVEISHLLFVQSGRNGGTWAHWQIALIYAHYLSPRLYLAWNEFARQCLDGTGRLAVIERRLALLERGIAAQRPKDAASYATGYQQVEDAIVALGGRASCAELRALLPHLRSDVIKVHCYRLLHRGKVRRIAYGCYELAA